MTWTYDAEQIANKTTYQVRFLIGDTDQACPQLEDEEIAFTLTQVAQSIYGAAALCCFSLSAAMSRLADQASGQSKISYSQRAKAYAMRRMEFEQMYAIRGGAIPYAGGISVTDIINRIQDTDRAPPAFAIGMDDNFIPIGPTGVEEGLQSPETLAQVSGPE